MSLNLQVPTPQNDQTHSNNSPAIANKFFDCVLLLIELIRFYSKKRQELFFFWRFSGIH